jgi:hypothetical protein
MGTFAKTAIVDYRLSFADQGAANKRKIAVSVFRLQQIHGSRRFPLVPLKYQRRLKLCSFHKNPF